MMNESVCGSDVMSVSCLIKLSFATHAILRGYSARGGPPLTLTQTVSPIANALCGVVQSAAKVSTKSGSEGGGGRKAGRNIGLNNRFDCSGPRFTEFAFGPAV